MKKGHTRLQKDKPTKWIESVDLRRGHQAASAVQELVVKDENREAAGVLRCIAYLARQEDKGLAAGGNHACNAVTYA